MYDKIGMSLFSQFIHVSRYARWLDSENRRETWIETVDRYINFMCDEQCKGHISAEIRQELRDSILNLRVMPSMRALMTAGPALAGNEVAAYNCSGIAITHPYAFDEILFLLMSGVGVGISVERQFICEMPIIANKFRNSNTVIIVEDSRNGWAFAFRELVGMLYGGSIPKWDVSKVRAAGERLKTFGGRASGPGPLEDLFRFTIDLFRNAAGRRLNSLECHDLCCKIGEIVVVGGVRRSAILSLSNPSDDRMRYAKSGEWWKTAPYRAIANISSCYTEKPSMDIFMREWLALYDSKSGERGIFNREAAKRQAEKYGRRDSNYFWICNPCLVGDTLVSVADGRLHVPIRQLADEGNDVPVYCFDDDGEVVIRMMRNPRLTRKSAEIVRVTLDDGSFIRVTKNHRFRLRSGQYVAAEDLNKGNSLAIKSLHRSSLSWLNEKSSEHRLIAEAMLGRKLENHYKCDYCGKSLREADVNCKISFCSEECYSSWQQEWERKSLSVSVKSHYVRKLRVRDEQMEVFTSLRCNLGRNPNKKEWQLACREKGVSVEISRKSSPFRYWNDLVEEAVGFNHRVVSVEADGIEDVYCGTVDEFHNFFVGGFECKTRKGRNKFVYLNNMNCSEIIGRSTGFLCNLTEIVARPDDNLETLKEKARIATILGTMQATLTNFDYLREIWKQNAEEERLIGVSITGIMDNSKLAGKEGKRKLAELLDNLREYVVETNKEWSKKLGINAATATTCTKPSGTVSCLVDSASGIHPRYSRYYIRTVRADKKDPLAQMMVEMGFPYEDDVMKPEYNWVFSFPMSSPENSITREDVSAIEQLELWKVYQEHWAEHKPSQTVYVREHEWMEVGAWVYRHFDSISGVAFLPYSISKHVYRQAPYQECDEEDYLKLLEKMPKEIDWKKLQEFEADDSTLTTKELACSAGNCEIVDIEQNNSV